MVTRCGQYKNKAHLLQLALQLLVLRYNRNLGLQVTVNRAVTKIRRANQSEARPILPPEVKPQTCRRGGTAEGKNVGKSQNPKEGASLSHAKTTGATRRTASHTNVWIIQTPPLFQQLYIILHFSLAPPT